MKAFLLDYLQMAYKKKFALPAFSIDNLSMLKSIIKGAELCHAPVIVMASESSLAYFGIKYLASAFKTAVSLAKIPVFLHFDHGKVIDHAKLMVDSGSDSVMLDWSLKSIDENIVGTRQVLDYAHKWGVAVEAEIGHVGGTEDNVTTDFAPMSDLKDVVRFYKACPVDLLAIAAGSAHGFYRANLNFDLIEQVSKKLKVPLVLHGSTGIPINQIKKSIKCGICKVNIGTGLRDVNVKAMRQYLVDHPNSYDVRAVETSGQKAMLDFVMTRIKMCGAQNRVISEFSKSD